MSILLEALRKSEKNQHPREVPTIHTGDQADTVKEPFRVLPIALLVVAALAVIGWFIWRQYQPVADYTPPVTLEAEEVQRLDEPPAGSGETASVASRTTASGSPDLRNRTPVESYQPAEPDASQASSQLSGHQSGTAAEQPASEVSEPRSIVRRLAGARNNQAATNQREETLPAAAATATAVPQAVAANEPPAKEEVKRDPRETQPISYWELPDSVRSGVPEIKFSVLVYAKDPADRFVLINGERLGEGDTAQPGLVVKEIRLDGVVFTYRLYQFLVER
jgi:general secretion pathway protein B